MEASIVVGLQFGDEGKGMSTDYLCSLYPVDNTIVVRFSGGQQAGHTVIHNGIKHIHSNFGSGTLRGVPSYFSEHCSIYLNTIDKEKSVLKEKGIEPKLIVHPLAKLTTPYDVAYNRIIEKTNQHGSCGLGVGTTMKRHNDTGYKLYAIDLIYPQLLLQKLENIKNYYKSKFPNELYRKEFIGEYLKYEHIFHELIFHYTELFSIEDYSHIIFTYEHIIFEGSQGIMLDMDHGLFPNVTYANTTCKNAIEICHKMGVDDIELHYITRCYQTRHGQGWMSNNKDIKLINNSEEINTFNEWQKEFKIGELDYDLLNYALSIDDIYMSNFEGGFKKNLVVTCLDQRPDFQLDIEKFKYKFKDIRKVSSPNS